MQEQLNPAICSWCANKHQEVCLAYCQPERSYRYLEPATLSDWELPPELPAFRVLMTLPAIERLALIYLAAVYERRQAEGRG
jgi:hypothetical protein